MKNYNFSIKALVVTAISFCSLLFNNGCTEQFEKFNTDSNGITDEQLKADFNTIGAFFPEIQYSVLLNSPSPSFVNLVAPDIEMLSSGSWSGYFMGSFQGSRNYNYFLFQAWEQFSLFGTAYNSVMSPVNEVKRRGAETLAPDFWSVALILRVATLHRVTDTFGPVPYSQFGQGGTAVAYDNQPAVYNAFFSDLDKAVAGLKAFIASKPGATPFQKFDKTYNGDYTKWLKYANSLRLRLAMRIVKIDPVLAKQQAEKAVDPANGGVLMSNAENALVADGINMVSVANNEWGDVRSGAALVTHLVGYNDPRLSKYFDASSIVPGKYVGIRVGSDITAQGTYLKFSNLSTTSFSRKTPAQLMVAAEVYFLKAEGALRGWNMGGAAKDLYEQGITASLSQWGVADRASTYINDAISKPADHVDPVKESNSAKALSTATIKWDDGVTNEQKLEKIITQKWIATFPDGTEAWSTFRRTGYPKLFPVVMNNSGGTISTEEQIRRMNYPQSEYTTNKDEVVKAVGMLGGPDTGGTRVWWDIKKPNF